MIAKRVLAVKKERADREKESGMMKERIDNERKEIQISVDKVISEQNFVQTTQKSFLVHTIQCNSIAPFQSIIGSGKYDKETSRRA